MTPAPDASAGRVLETVPHAIGAVSEAARIPEVRVSVVERVAVVVPEAPPRESADVDAGVASDPDSVTPAVPHAQFAMPEQRPAAVPAPPVVVAPPPAEEAARPEWMDVIESLKRDVERLQAERARPARAAS